MTRLMVEISNLITCSDSGAQAKRLLMLLIETYILNLWRKKTSNEKRNQTVLSVSLPAPNFVLLRWTNRTSVTAAVLPELKKTQVSHRSDWITLLFPSEKHFASWFSLFELPCITSKTFSLQNRADAEKSPCKSDIHFRNFCLWFLIKSLWWF